jgi:hypothetical protein
MIDWRSELASTRRRIAELEKKISIQKQKSPSGTTALLDILQESLRHAEDYRRVIELKLADGSMERAASGRAERADAAPDCRAVDGNTDSPQPKQVLVRGITINIE